MRIEFVKKIIGRRDRDDCCSGPHRCSGAGQTRRQHADFARQAQSRQETGRGVKHGTDGVGSERILADLRSVPKGTAKDQSTHRPRCWRAMRTTTGSKSLTDDKAKKLIDEAVSDRAGRSQYQEHVRTEAQQSAAGEESRALPADREQDPGRRQIRHRSGSAAGAVKGCEM